MSPGVCGRCVGVGIMAAVVNYRCAMRCAWDKIHAR